MNLELMGDLQASKSNKMKIKNWAEFSSVKIFGMFDKNIFGGTAETNPDWE